MTAFCPGCNQTANVSQMHVQQFENLQRGAVLQAELQAQDEAMRQGAFQAEMEAGAREQLFQAEMSQMREQAEAHVRNVEMQAERAIEQERRRTMQMTPQASPATVQQQLVALPRPQLRPADLGPKDHVPINDSTDEEDQASLRSPTRPRPLQLNAPR